MRPEDGNTRRLLVHPLVPAHAPSVIMDVYLVFPQVHDLCLQPLVYGVLHIDPHTNFKLPLHRFVLLHVSEVLGVDVRLLALSVHESPVVLHDGKILLLLGLFAGHLGLKQKLDVVHGPPQHVERLRLVETNLLQVEACVLLEDEPTISPENVGFVEGAHYLLDKVEVADALHIYTLVILVGVRHWSLSGWSTEKR